jgi:hypothetical protein
MRTVRSEQVRDLRMKSPPGHVAVLSHADVVRTFLTAIEPKLRRRKTFVDAPTD